MQETDFGSIIRDAVKASGVADPYDYVVRAIRPLAIQAMNEAMAGCKDCKMNKDGHCNKSHLLAENPDAINVLVISDYPVNPSEGRPLADSEMDMLNQAYECFGVDTQQIAYINAVSCEPRFANGGMPTSRLPTSEEVNNCKVFTDYAIKVLQPKLILLMGNFALNAYIHDVNIKTVRGYWTEINGVKAMPTYSPTQIAKLVNMDECDDLQEEMKNAFGDDLYQAFKWLQESYPEVNFAPKLLDNE